MKRRLALGLCFTTFISSVVTPQALAQAPLTAYQGGQFYTRAYGSDRAASCTISYNNAAQRISYTAAHCGKAGDTVFLRDYRGVNVAAGTFSPSNQFAGHLTNDWGVIRWDPHVVLGANIFSGDTVVHPSQLRKGDRVCVRGVTAHGPASPTGSTTVNCAPFLGSINNTFFFENAGTRPGDSGGVVFAPGRGYLGVLSGVSELTSPGRANTVIQRGAFPANGAAISKNEMLRWANANLPMPVEKVNTVPVVPPADANASASSAQGIGAIVAALVAFLAVALPFAQQIMGNLCF